MSGDDVLDEGAWIDDMPPLVPPLARTYFPTDVGPLLAAAHDRAAARSRAASRADEDARARQRKIGVKR